MTRASSVMGLLTLWLELLVAVAVDFNVIKLNRDSAIKLDSLIKCTLPSSSSTFSLSGGSSVVFDCTTPDKPLNCVETDSPCITTVSPQRKVEEVDEECE